MSRTTNEILARIESREPHALFDFGHMQLVACLPYEEAQAYLKDDVSREDFAEAAASGSTEKWARQHIRDYFDFAARKAENKRGLSAMRSVQKYKEWIWLTRNKEAFEAFEEADYEPYGRPKLDVVQEYFDVDPND